MIKTFTSKTLKPVLMKKSPIGVKEPYFLIEDNQNQAVFVVSPGKNGAEYNKTLGYFSNFPSVQTFLCLYGQGILMMQKNDSFGVKEFKISTLSSNKQVLVPAGWGMGLVNTGASYLVVLRIGNGDEKYQETEPILEKKGFAYYIVEKKGEIGFEENPNYQIHPQITTE